mmetsp:Transcript_75093/g.176150  ORF Transcript_75093/g.176150 Transcript_75093/m.176150 type:complete len:314 (-) Transcript_75093:548-1489(-)
MPYSLRHHFVRGGTDRWRQEGRAGRGHVLRHWKNEETCEVDKDGIHLFVRVGSEEANGGTNETHVVWLRVKLTASSHELHHWHEYLGGWNVLPGETEDVTESQADLLHQLLILRVVDANALDCRKVLLYDTQDRVMIHRRQASITRWHVVHAGHRCNVELQLDWSFAIARGLYRTAAQRLRWQRGKYWLNGPFHAGYEHTESMLQVVPVSQHGKHLADAEHQLRTAVNVQAAVSDQVDHRRDCFLPRCSTLQSHDGLACSRHDHLHGIASQSLAVLLHILLRALLQRQDRRKVLQGKELQDLLARCWMKRQVA